MVGRVSPVVRSTIIGTKGSKVASQAELVCPRREEKGAAGAVLVRGCVLALAPFLCSSRRCGPCDKRSLVERLLFPDITRV